MFWLPEAFHLDFATQDQIEFTLLPLGDEFFFAITSASASGSNFASGSIFASARDET